MNNKKNSILIVEDDILISNSIAKSLDEDLFTVAETAISGQEAIDKFQTTSPDLVLMDINLKGKMDGIETSSKIQEINNIPIVFLTAYSDKTTIQRIKSISPHGYILKPFRKRELNIVIEMALNKYHFEKKLEESTMRYRGLVDNAPIGILSIDNDGKIVDINPELLYILGFSSIAAAQEINIYEYKPMIHSGISKEIQDCLKNQETNNFECTYIAESGKYMILRNIVKPDLDLKGSPQGGLLLVEDITENSEIESELSDAEEKLSMALLGSDVGLFDLNIETGEIFYSNKGNNIMDYVPGEIDMTFDSWKDRIHPDDISNVLSAWQSHLEERNDLFESEYRLKSKSDKWKWVISKGAVIKRDKQREPLRMIGTHQDITEYKLEKKVFDVYKQKFEAMIENFPFYSMLWEHRDDEFILINYNKNLIELSLSEIINYLDIEAKIYFKDYSFVLDEMKKCFAEKNNIMNKKASYKNQFSKDRKNVIFNYLYIPDNQVFIYIVENEDKKI